MTRFALAIGVKGLINAQFIVRDDGVYLLEVNPRASRTVPFLSKVTGVPMVELATRVALGATLAELGWTGGLRPPPAVVAVKAPVFSTSKLKGVDPAAGPGHALDGRGHRHPRRRAAWRWPRRSWRRRCGRPCRGPMARSCWCRISDRDKPRLAELAASLASVGYRFAATAGTAAALRAAGPRGDGGGAAGGGVGADGVAGAPPILDVIASGEVSLVVNTPSPRSGPVRDAAAIRLAAVSEGILCLTSMDTAIAAARSLDAGVQRLVADVRPHRRLAARSRSRPPRPVRSPWRSIQDRLTSRPMRWCCSSVRPRRARPPGRRPASGRRRCCPAMRFREMVADDASDQTASRDAFQLLHAVARARLQRGLLTVIDATNLQRSARKPLLALAARFGRPAVAVVFDVPLDVLLERNANRARSVPEDVIRRHHGLMAAPVADIETEGYASLAHLTVIADAEHASSADVPAPSVRLGRYELGRDGTAPDIPRP